MAISGTQGWPERLWRIFNGTFTESRGALRVVHDLESGFGEFLTVERTPIIEINSSYGLSVLRHLENTLNGAIISDGVGEIDLSTGTNADGFAELDSGEVGRYIPGFAAEIGIGARISVDPVGTQFARWGGHGEAGDNGLYWGKDATGWFIELVRDGASFIKKHQSDFNIDKVDGTGNSGFDINNVEGNIFQIDFTWYGYGRILWSVVGQPSLGTQIPIPVHEESGFDRASITSPNLKLHSEVSNGGTTASDFTLNVGGQQYSILGNYRPKYRITGETNTATSVGTTRIPLVSFLRKSSFGDRSVKLEGTTVTVFGNDDVNYEIVLDGTLTGESFDTPTNHLATETALESDTSATAISGGHVIYKDHVQAGQTSKEGLSRAEIDVDIPNGKAVTLCAYTDAGTSDVKVSFRMREEW